ncbi:MAG: tRNA (adenosine(37)-N6)-threonylcarbamoyltransferase complex transferase subunit TsaD, partial [Paludibacteraceae bacterium]|nr:tRNA (adenosine(37)-N6)-threonylcarbamoyltransferase complex transferase subunit TsaD [Paludibacteraceae bacterium]
IDKLAKEGNAKAFKFHKPQIEGYNYSFSGLKTSFLYTLRDHVKEDPDFIKNNLNDLCASLQATVIEILMDKLRKAVKTTGINHVAVAGGVSANSALRGAFEDHSKRFGWNIYIPKFSYTTDNAAMIGIVGYHKFLDKDFSDISLPPYSRVIL